LHDGLLFLNLRVEDKEETGALLWAPVQKAKKLGYNSLSQLPARSSASLPAAGRCGDAFYGFFQMEISLMDVLLP
jgi:hypothetical protein